LTVAAGAQSQRPMHDTHVAAPGEGGLDRGALLGAIAKPA
jgi:hypothetical protein